MIVCDSGPLISACNRAEGRRHEFAAGLLASLGRRVLVPWSTYVEVHLVLRARGHIGSALIFGRALLGGTHRLDHPTDAEHDHALDLVERYAETGLDLVDASVMAIAAARSGLILTWDFRHFRAAVPARGRHWPLLVQEHEVPER
ncbi:MAG: type II toxin-antitoxin system VapC family toxin [Candidatus Binatia bacterium]